jgi:predicted nucleic acid-binding protein
MMVLVDTSVWSLALRRRQTVAVAEAHELARLINDMRVQLIGPIRQEILSGIKSEAHYRALREQLRAFPDLPLNSDDFEYAAELFNTARARGIQGSNTDFLICAVAIRHTMTIFTTDNDFRLFSNHIPIRLYEL